MKFLKFDGFIVDLENVISAKNDDYEGKPCITLNMKGGNDKIIQYRMIYNSAWERTCSFNSLSINLDAFTIDYDKLKPALLESFDEMVRISRGIDSSVYIILKELKAIKKELKDIKKEMKDE